MPTRNNARGVLAPGIALWLALFPLIAEGQGKWTVRAGVGYAEPGGSSLETRTDGTVATSDIAGGYLFTLRVERRLSRRLGVELGALGFSIHRFTMHEDLPDGSTFDASDSFRFQALIAGVSLRFFPEKAIDVVVEPFVLYSMYDDLFLPNAAPPLDRPREVNTRRAPGAGVMANLDITAGRMTFGPWIGFALTRFGGPYTPESAAVANDTEIGVGFNPLMAGLGVVFRL